MIENIRGYESGSYIDYYYFYFGRFLYVASYKFTSKDLLFNYLFNDKRLSKISMKILYSCEFKKILEEKISNDFKEKI
jgi:hypothetical protein